MTDVVEFIAARLDEDEQTARAAAETGVPEWRFTVIPGDPDGYSLDLSDERILIVDWTDRDDLLPNEAEHAARHDPARVLREVEAKRRILAEHTPEQGIPYDGGDENDPSTWVPCCSACQVGVVHEGDWPCLHLRLLALPYADHEDYQQEWAV